MRTTQRTVFRVGPVAALFAFLIAADTVNQIPALFRAGQYLTQAAVTVIFQPSAHYFAPSNFFHVVALAVMIPSGTQPFFFWNAMTAFLVLFP